MKQDIEDAKEELAQLIFQCARYQRPSTDWKAALDKFCETYLAKQPVESEPVAWTNRQQFEYLSDPSIASTLPMAMWKSNIFGFANVPLYATPQPCPKCAEWEQKFALEHDDVLELQAKVAELTQDLQTTSDALGHADSNDRELIEEQLGTIKALNIALGGEDSTSTENLIDAYEVDYNEEGLISLCRKMVAENVRLGDTVEFQKAGWASDYEQLTRAEAVIEKCNLALELNVPLLTTRLAAIFAIAAYREGK